MSGRVLSNMFERSLPDKLSVVCRLYVGLVTVFTRGKFWPSGIVVPASVCLCVRVSVCVYQSRVFRTVTHHSFKLESPNLKQRCKRPCLRCLLFLGMIDLDLQGQI